MQRLRRSKKEDLQITIATAYNTNDAQQFSIFFFLFHSGEFTIEFILE